MDFFYDEELLADSNFLGIRANLKGAFAERVRGAPIERRMRRPALHVDLLVVYRHLLGNGDLFDLGPNAHASTLNLLLANLQAFFDHWDMQRVYTLHGCAP